MRRIAPQQYCTAMQQRQPDRRHASYAEGDGLATSMSQGGAACGAKKEAARRRPESREETPKEGMYGKRRTVFNVAPIVTNARILSPRSATC
jgi:hypothetical protein